MLSGLEPGDRTIDLRSKLGNRWLLAVPIEPISLYGLQSPMFTGAILVQFSL